MLGANPNTERTGQDDEVRILWLKTELLHPIDKGGKIRTYFTLRELRRHHHLTYLTLDDGQSGPEAVERADEYCHELVRVPHVPTPKFGLRFYLELAGNLASKLPYALARYRSGPMESRLETLLGQGDFDLVICDFLAPDVNVPTGIGVPTILFQHNVEAMIWKRHSEVQGNRLRRAYFAHQWRKMLAYERGACRHYDHVIAVSEDDRDEMRRAYGAKNVDAVPTGVDTDFFTPSGRVAVVPKNLVFVGSMDWLPNEDAVEFFVREVWATVRRAEPDATWTIVGRNPGVGVRALAERGDGIEVTGRVEDVRPYLERAAVAIVPLRIGGGTRLKIYEAMAMGLPTVSTSIGAEGLPLANGDELHLADRPEDLAARIVELIRDPEAARAMGARAQRRVRADFSWETAVRPFIDICERVVARQSGSGDRIDPALTKPE